MKNCFHFSKELLRRQLTLIERQNFSSVKLKVFFDNNNNLLAIIYIFFQSKTRPHPHKLNIYLKIYNFIKN